MGLTGLTMLASSIVVFAAGVEPGSVVGEVVRNVNAFRHAEARGPVKGDEKLAATARDFAAFMARTGRFDHEADGRTPAQRAEQHGYAYCIVTENIGYEQRSPEFTSGELARRLFEGWKHSPPHRRNMLDRDVIETGVGIAQNPGNGRWYAVQLFGTPDNARVRFEVENGAGVPLRYRVGDRTYDLPPRVTRTHQECRPGELSLVDSQTANAVSPKQGIHYVIDGSAGALVIRDR